MPIGGFEKLQHISDNLGSHMHMKDCSHVLERYEKGPNLSSSGHV